MRYPHVSFLGNTILDVLEFIFKYSAIITISHFFIKRSGALVSKEEKKKYKTLWKYAGIAVYTLLLLIVITEIIQYV